jgi:hypothetical protein
VPDCVRRAWLTCDGRTMPLEDLDAGYVCDELDLGWPEVREVVNPRPDADGIDDRTQFFGSRAVTADITAAESLGAVVDEVASSFGYYMHPQRRVELHYVLERPGNPERVLIVRGSDYSWPIDGGGRRAVHLGWVAADPIARDVLVNHATAWAGSATTSGRTYDLVFPRTYPAGGGAAVVGVAEVEGDVPVRPLLRIYGPATAPTVASDLLDSGGAHVFTYALTFKAGVVIDAGRYIEVDCDARTAYADGDPAAPMLDQIAWTVSQWIVFQPAPFTNRLSMSGGSTASGVTQVQAAWRDGYLT